MVEMRERVNGVGEDVGAFARASDDAYDDPMSKVLGMDAQTSTLAAWFGFTGGGTALAAALMALVTLVAWLHATKRLAADVPEEIEVLKEDTPPPPPAPVAEPEPEATPGAPPPRAAPPAAAAPPPAQAAKVLAQEPDPNEPVDLTGNVIVQGNADTYAGGFTAANGTNANAARTAPGGSAGGAAAPPPPPPPSPPKPDQSRTAALGGGGEWSCPFPPEADTAQIDEAYVMLQVDVRADGSPTAVRILNDPGNGFGREARRCGMNKRYTTALDHDGNAVDGATRPFRVHFSR
jgi:protein TonB